jgi:hypothetical protein
LFAFGKVEGAEAGVSVEVVAEVFGTLIRIVDCVKEAGFEEALGGWVELLLGSGGVGEEFAREVFGFFLALGVQAVFIAVFESF